MAATEDKTGVFNLRDLAGGKRCPECDGTRLNQGARSSKIDGVNIADAAAMQITDLAACPDGNIVTIDSTMNANGVRVFKDGAERTTAPPRDAS